MNKEINNICLSRETKKISRLALPCFIFVYAGISNEKSATRVESGDSTLSNEVTEIPLV